MAKTANESVPVPIPASTATQSPRPQPVRTQPIASASGRPPKRNLDSTPSAQPAKVAAPSAPEPAIAAIEETTTGVQQAAAAAELSSNTEILHGQVQSLGSQVERLQDSKASAVRVM